MHDRETVRLLQNAHADHIESEYRQLSLLPGNPKGIEILKVGQTRVFLSNGDEFQNRAIFTGNETEEEFQQVMELFDRKAVVGYFELNPSNFYRTEPFSWRSEVLPILLKLGCHPDGFRCVWCLDRMDAPATETVEASGIQAYSWEESSEYVKRQLEVEPVPEERYEEERRMCTHLFTKDRRRYIGYEDGRPVSVSSLFLKSDCGYLAWGYTQKEYRRRGHHRRHVVARVRDAFEYGCQRVFSVTDFNVSSSKSLQKCHFRLAYNYLMMARVQQDGRVARSGRAGP